MEHEAHHAAEAGSADDTAHQADGKRARQAASRQHDRCDAEASDDDEADRGPDEEAPGCRRVSLGGDGDYVVAMPKQHDDIENIS